jgi:hypothetical protein
MKWSLIFVLFESPFTSVSTVSRGHLSVVSHVFYCKAELTSLISPPQVLDLSGAALFNFCCERLLYVCLQCSKPFREGDLESSPTLIKNFKRPYKSTSTVTMENPNVPFLTVYYMFLVKNNAGRCQLFLKEKKRCQKTKRNTRKTLVRPF